MWLWETPWLKTRCLREERLCVLIWKFPFLQADNILRRVKIGIAIPSPVLSLGEQLFYRSSWWKIYSCNNTEHNLWCWWSRAALYGMWKGKLEEIHPLRDLMWIPGCSRVGRGFVLLFPSHSAELLWGLCNPWVSRWGWEQELPHPSQSSWCVHLPFCPQEPGWDRDFFWTGKVKNQPEETDEAEINELLLLFCLSEGCSGYISVFFQKNLFSSKNC